MNRVLAEYDSKNYVGMKLVPEHRKTKSEKMKS